MHEKQQETNMFCLFFTLLKLPVPFVITKIATERSPYHFVYFYLVQLLVECGLESRYLIFHMSVGI